MTAIDPIILLVCATVILGALSLLFFMSPGAAPTKAGAAAVKTPKKKKPSSASKTKSSASKKKASVSSSEEPDLSEPEPKQTVKFEEPVKEQPIVIESPVEEPIVEISAPEKEKKGKKAKETPEQKEARLQRAKLAKKEKSKESTTVSEIASPSIPPSLLNETAYINNLISTTSAPQHFDGWAVVEERRKGKPKKGDEADGSPDAEQSPLPVPNQPSPTPVAAPDVNGISPFVKIKLYRNVGF